MVTAELSHNPFLLETEVRFNGRGPQINCAISKFEGEPLSNWVHEVPRIFHDEMNGYEFDLLFSGTDADYERVVQAFRDAHVPDDSVRVLRKGSLQEADVKLREVRELISWLEENPSDRLDMESLAETRPELTDATFALILLHGDEARVRFSSVSAESVDNIDELHDLDLTNTPVIVFITPDVSSRIRGEMIRLLDRRDVAAGQLFFAIHPMLNKEKVVRTITDLGVPNPQIVTSPDDSEIAAYLLAHPVSEYIHKSIKALSAEAERISSELVETGQLTAKSNSEGREKADEYDGEIASLKESDELLSHFALPEAPREFSMAASAFKEATAKWYGRKRKIMDEMDAIVAAEELQRSMSQFLVDFVRSLDNATKESRMRIDAELAEAYSAAGVDAAYRPSYELSYSQCIPKLPNVKSEVLALKEIELVERWNDFIGLFGGSVGEPEKVLVTTYYMDVWRAKVRELFEPSLRVLMETRKAALRDYQQAVVEDYREHIAVLVAERRAKKEDTLARMSDEDRVLQAENDWLSSFKGMLQEIKRG